MYKALPHLHIEKGKCNNPEKWGKKIQVNNAEDAAAFFTLHMLMGIRYKSNKKRHSSNYIKLAYNIVFKKKNKRF